MRNFIKLGMLHVVAYLCLQHQTTLTCAASCAGNLNGYRLKCLNFIVYTQASDTGHHPDYAAIMTGWAIGLLPFICRQAASILTLWLTEMRNADLALIPPDRIAPTPIAAGLFTYARAANQADGDWDISGLT
jgi:hypothetical protein